MTDYNRLHASAINIVQSQTVMASCCVVSHSAAAAGEGLKALFPDVAVPNE